VILLLQSISVEKNEKEILHFKKEKGIQEAGQVD
jgi:hypothetical protein